MTGRNALLVALFATTIAAGPPEGSTPARPGRPSIRWTATGRHAVEVYGLDLAAFAQAGTWNDARWARHFRVSVHAEPSGRDTPPIAGTYRVANGALRFEPRFPFEPGVRYEARVPITAPSLVSEFALPAPAPSAPASLTRVDPAADRLPENLLKFYLHFSKPMGRGKAYDHVRILDSQGDALRSPFLELGEELWDPSGTRLTLLLDPGRIKRGLRPREEEGPILEAGKAYTLVVDRDWPDAEGQALGESFRKPFRAGPADETQPDPKTWTVVPPTAGSSESLTVTFPESLDRAILDRAVVVRAPDGRSVAGAVEVAANATRWRFRPAQAWAAGTYTLVIDAELEDLAGNSIARPFEVDVFNRVAPRQETPTATLPVVIRARP